MFAAVKRVVKNSWVSFERNGWLSTATVVIMVLTLCMSLALILTNYVGAAVLSYLENKIDLSIYFKPDAQEDLIKNAQKEIGNLSYVKAVSYISKDEALANFQERNKNNPTAISALEALGENPLSPSLAIKTNNPSDYDALAQFIQASDFQNLIDNITYYQNKQVIQRVGAFINTARAVGLVIGVILAAIAILITFNTVRLAIYSQREEISIMRLVGASNWYIRGPFLIAGIIYGIIAGLIAILVFIPVVIWISPYLLKFLPETNLANYYLSNFGTIFLTEILIGIVVGIASSLIAVNRYLKI